MGRAQDPISVAEAIYTGDADELQKSMEQRLLIFMTLGIWELAVLPKEEKPVNYKLVFHPKFDENRRETRDDARPMAKAFSRTSGIGYDDVFHLILEYIWLRYPLKPALHWKYSALKLYSSGSFLNGTLA